MLAGVAAGAFLAFVAAAALNLRADRVFWTLDLANVAAILAALVWTLS